MPGFEDEPAPPPMQARLRREAPPADEPRRSFARRVLGLFYVLAGALHLAWPKPFIGIVPDWVPMPALVVALTGMAELAGATALLQSRWPAWRRAAGWGLAAYALCVWPANFHHMMLDLAKPHHRWWLLYHVPRLLAQPLLIWAAPWAAGARWRFSAGR